MSELIYLFMWACGVGVFYILFSVWKEDKEWKKRNDK